MNMNETKRERMAALAAFDAMIAARQLKPPPLPRTTDLRSAGARELAREIRAGHYTPGARMWG